MSESFHKVYTFHTRWYEFRYPVKYRLQQIKKNTNSRESRTANFVTKMTAETEGNLIHVRFLYVEREEPKPKYVS
jgi:hypothetical protein